MSPAETPAANPDSTQPGLQVERTRLAWRRTTLSASVVLMIELSALLSDDARRPHTMFAIAAAALGWLAMVTISFRRIDSLRRSGPAASAAHATPAAAAVLTVLAAVLGGVIVLG